MVKTAPPCRKICVWCFAVVVALIPLLLLFGWFLFSPR